MKFEPKTYQSEAIRLCCEKKKFSVFAKPGTGKTAIGLSVAATLIQLSLIKKALVVAPLKVAESQWSDEAAKWDHTKHLRCSQILGNPAARERAMAADADIYIINYDNLPWLMDIYKKLKRFPYQLVIADESSKLKAPSSDRFKSIRFIAKKVPYWINFSGTPIASGLKAIWAQQFLIDNGAALGETYGIFKSRYFIEMAEHHVLKPLAGARERVEKAIADTSLSVFPAEHMKLPELIIKNEQVTLPDSVRTIYTEFLVGLRSDLEGLRMSPAVAMTRTNKCLQIASGAVYVDSVGTWEPLHDEKLKKIKEIVERENQNVIIAYHYKFDLERLRVWFPEGEDLSDKKDNQERWNKGWIPVLFLHPASAGHGLNLQHGGCVLIFLSNWWSLENYEQTIERIGPTRQAQSGLNRDVTVYNVIAKDTVDEAVVARRKSHATVQHAFMEYLKRVA